MKRAEALEREGVLVDPIEIISSYGNCTLADWRVVGSATDLTVLALGIPIKSLIFCYDRGLDRECVLIDDCGKEVARVIGRRAAQSKVPNLSIDGLMTTVDRVVFSKPTSEGR